MRENSEIVDIVISLYKQKGWSLSEFARKLEMPKSSLSRYLNKNRQFPVNKTEIFADKLNTTVEYILGLELENQSVPSLPKSTPNPISAEVIRLDKELKDPRHGQWVSHGERLLEEQQRAEQIQEAREVAEPTAHYHIERPNISSFDEYRKRVPKTVDFAASAGTGVCQEENLDMEVMFYEDELAEDYDSIGIVMGSSMEPVLKNGDYLFVKITTDIPNGAISIWQVNGENYVKKFRNNGRPYLESLNPEFDDIDLDEDDDIRPLGVVVDVYREN